MRGTAAYSLPLLAFALLLTSCSMSASPPPDYNAILAQPDRSDADRQNDQRRHAAEMLAFTGVRPGWKVLDMGADAGYSTELMARSTAPSGVVYGQNPADAPARAMDAYTARAKGAGMKNAITDRRPFDDPLPPGAGPVDLITFFFAYHDTTYMTNVDRSKMDKAMFDALKPGGTLVVADYEALPGAPITTGKQFHRLDDAIEKREIEAAGFKLVDEANFLRNPADPKNFIIFGAKIPIDSYVLKFQKP
jgi:predicted methyltransferase